MDNKLVCLSTCTSGIYTGMLSVLFPSLYIITVGVTVEFGAITLSGERMEETLASWMPRVDEGGERGLLPIVEAVNEFPDFVRKSSVACIPAESPRP